MEGLREESEDDQRGSVHSHLDLIRALVLNTTHRVWRRRAELCHQDYQSRLGPGMRHLYSVIIAAVTACSLCVCVHLCA